MDHINTMDHVNTMDCIVEQVGGACVNPPSNHANVKINIYIVNFLLSRKGRIDTDNTNWIGHHTWYRIFYPPRYKTYPLCESIVFT